jgi:hypothetical protein
MRELSNMVSTQWPVPANEALEVQNETRQVLAPWARPKKAYLAKVRAAGRKVVRADGGGEGQWVASIPKAERLGH